MKDQVPHNFPYHAEIRYESERGFNYVSALGESLIDLIEDIKFQLNNYAHRLPELEVVYELPNTKRKDITNKVRSLLGDDNG